MKRLLIAIILLGLCGIGFAGEGKFADRYPRVGYLQENLVLDLGPEDFGSASTWPDQSGNGNNASQATAANQPTIQGSVGADVTARSFDGSNDYIEIASDSSFNTSNTESYTVALWVNLLSSGANNLVYGRLPTGDDTLNGGEHYMQYEGAPGVFIWGVIGASWNTGVAFTKNVWNHAVVVFNADTSTAYMFLNGVISATKNSATMGTSNEGPLKIGDNYNVDFLGASIASFQIFTTALTAAEIQYLYNRDRERFNQ